MKHFKLIVPDEGKEIYMPRETQSFGYRYGPTIMCNDGIAEAWFASPGDCFEADWFTYRRSEDGGKTWSSEKVVMAPTPDSMDWYSVCDPAIFKYGEYYYMGYTSTVFADGGGVGNNGYVGRSKSPTGPFEKWTGEGWGEHRTVNGKDLHWIGNPAPIIYFDEGWREWGAGEFSFVVKDDVLFIYYTWTTHTSDGKFSSSTRVATADITREDWPATIVDKGVAVQRPSGGNDSYDVVFCEDLNKFVALSTDKRFKENSILAVYESDDGLRFKRVNEIKTNISFMCHNCGMSGDYHHHIKSGDLMFLGYAYGNKWGKWATRMHRYDFTLMDEDFYSEDHLENVSRDSKLWPHEDNPEKSYLTMVKPHYLRLHIGESAKPEFVFYNVCYDKIPALNVSFSNFDDTVISIENGIVTALAEGYTYVKASQDGFDYEFLVYVHKADVIFDDPNKVATSFVPMQRKYIATLSGKEVKQIRGMAIYSDYTKKEICEAVDRVTYENSNPEVIRVDENGLIYPIGVVGSAKVKAICDGLCFEVDVEITE
ncbi:MAG: exo-alpha-sialidase [Clostridia bacterium]|nr:exo-alpha-sialidase [Clostridia bacterium]